MKIARARQFLDAVATHDFEAAEELLDPDVETVTRRGTLRGIQASQQVLQKASGDEQFEMEQAALAGVKPAKWRMSAILRCA